MRGKRGNFGLILLAAAAVAFTPQLPARADTQGSASWKNENADNSADLYLKLVDDDGDKITAAQIDIMLSVEDPLSIESANFVFNGAWGAPVLEQYHYDAQTGKMTIFAATDGKTGLHQMSSLSDEIKIGAISAESKEPVRAVIKGAKVISDGVMEEVPSIHGDEVTLAATLEGGGPEEEQPVAFTGTFEPLGNPEEEDFTVKITGDGYSESFVTEDGTFSVELKKGNYTAAVTEMPADYKLVNPEEETVAFEANDVPVSHTWQVEHVIKPEEPEDHTFLHTIIVKDHEENPVPGTQVKINGGSIKDKTFTADENGEIELSDTVKKTDRWSVAYQYEITSVPEGYEIHSAFGQITVSDAGASSSDLYVRKTAQEPDVEVANSRDMVITVRDDKLFPIEDVKLEVTGGAEPVVDRTDANGQIRLKDLKYGAYEVTVQEVPKGYEIVDKKKSFNVSKTDAGEVELSVKKTVTAPAEKTKDITLIVTDDGENVVQDVRMIVTGPDTNKQVTSDHNGEALLTGLKYGTYTAEVQSVPKGYAINVKRRTFSVSETSESDVMVSVVRETQQDVEDSRDVNLIVRDTDGKAVPNVKLHVIGNGVSKVCVTDGNGRAVVLDLVYGDYEAAVLEVPDGYELPTTVKKFKVTETGDIDIPITVKKKEVQKPDTNGNGTSKPGGSTGQNGSTGQSGSSKPSTGHSVGGGFSHSSGGSYSSGRTLTQNVGSGSSSGVNRWSYNRATDKWTLNNGQYKNRWVYVEEAGHADWFAFDEEGNMRTGWFEDADGTWYYLNEKSDGTRGAMLTGWFLDPDGAWYYLNELSDGTKGAMLTGWQWINGKCYYLSDGSIGPKGHMFVSTTTPDGYKVDESGAWVVDGIQVVR